MDERVRSTGCLLLGLLLVALVLYPPAFFGLEDDRRHYETTVSPEGTEAFETELSRVDAAGASANALDSYRYGELSPEAREFVDAALEEPPHEDGSYEYEARVCAPRTVACPLYGQDDLPPELSYAVPSAPTDAALFVERDGQRYLVTTSGVVAGAVTPSPFGLFPQYAIRGLVLLPFASVLGVLGARRFGAVSDAVPLGYLVAFLGLAWYEGLSPVLAGLALLPLLPGLLAPESGDRRGDVLALGIGGLLAGIAVGPFYLAAYVGRSLEFGPVTLAGLVVSWCGVAVVASGVLRSDRSEVHDGSVNRPGRK